MALPSVPEHKRDYTDRLPMYVRRGPYSRVPARRRGRPHVRALLSPPALLPPPLHLALSSGTMSTLPGYCYEVLWLWSGESLSAMQQ